MRLLILVAGLLTSEFALSAPVVGYVFADKNNNGIRDKGEDGVKDVLISDQVTVVSTNAEGFYQLDAKGNGFIMMSLPQGYTAKTWWATAAPSVDFPLTPVPVKNSFTFIHASDTHISEKSLPRMQLLRDIVAANKPDFVIITGDLVKDALRVSEKEASGYFDLYVKEIQKFPVPVWSVPGNHENFGIERQSSLVSKSHPLYGKKMYFSYLGPNYYSFNYGGVHFVGLDDVDFEDLWYYGHVDSTQVAWLKKDLENTPATTPVITFNHMPFFSGGLSTWAFEEDGPGRALERVNGKLQFRHVASNAREVVDLVGRHPYPIALAGHFHSRQVFWFESNGQKTRYEQAAAVVEPSRDGNLVMLSGVTLYTVKDGKIDEGKFIPLDKN